MKLLKIKLLFIILLLNTPTYAEKLCAYLANGKRVTDKILTDDKLGIRTPIQYKNQQGKVIIPLSAGFQTFGLAYQGSDAACSPKCFRQHAWLYNGKDYDFVDNKGKVWYQIYWFDMGADYPKEGLFRIKQNGLIGYASEKNKKIVIPARFQAAFPFENGRAKVAYRAKSKCDGEGHCWSVPDPSATDLENRYFYINKKGEFLAWVYPNN
ncbi:WG repeat-containing protein [Wielerella bovis]|uniref:WG repeat-containing protein n=1 Tax=Wielerella bovis TaxID=2917790 RepID=UPI002018F141|nr:WG repeat-containing protein [Wielerella bovis]ULJ69666.1 WG repeat-containing protein [Wielerella bovis]